MNRVQLEKLNKAYNFLAERNAEFKREWDYLNSCSVEEIKNNPVISKKAKDFAIKYDKILAEIIKLI